jgi:hypothetical protein
VIMFFKIFEKFTANFISSHKQHPNIDQRSSGALSSSTTSDKSKVSLTFFKVDS